MAIDVDAIQSFSDADLLKIVNAAIADLARYGRMQQAETLIFERASMKELTALREQLSSKVSAASRGRVVTFARRQRS